MTKLIFFRETQGFDGEPISYLTINENNVFVVFPKLSVIYKSENKKRTVKYDSFSLVAEEGLEPTTSRL